MKQILQREIKYHNKGMEEHSKLFKKTRSKKQKEKVKKHFHKKYQTIKIAKLIGFEYCSNCGSLK